MINKNHIVSLVFLIIGLILLAFGVFQGEVSFGLAVFIPFIIGSGFYALLGIVLVFFGIILLFIVHIPIFYSNGRKTTHLSKYKEVDYQQKTVKSGGIILIGPIPIVFGSTKKMVISLLLVAIVCIILFWVIIPSVIAMP